jgi:acetate kinase
MDNGILVLNAGSSSLKFAVFRETGDPDGFQAAFQGQISGIGSKPVFRASSIPEPQSLQPDKIGSHRQAISYALRWIGEQTGDMQLIGVGHRVVHGGPERQQPARVTPELLDALDALSPLAPHHQPHNLAAIRAVAETAPELPQVACFDTAFHTTQSTVARRLPLPQSLCEQGLQRYGFHGLSYEYITGVLPEYNGGQLPQRLIVAHLGNGASLCAIRDGESIATSMGFSTLDGLLMGTRCGSIDPGVLLHLMREQGMDERALSDLLYNKSGLLGVSGISGDMQVLLDSDSAAAAEAVELFCYTLVRAIGSMAAALGGVDALVFTGGIGEHAAAIRERVCRKLGWLGLAFDSQANLRHGPPIVTQDSDVSAWVIPTNEELVIVRHTATQVADPA